MGSPARASLPVKGKPLTIEYGDSDVPQDAETADLPEVDRERITPDDEAESSPYEAEDFDGKQDVDESDDDDAP